MATNFNPGSIKRITISGVMTGLLLSSGFSAAADLMPDRRRNQFPENPAHLVVPLPWSYPGVGEGLFVMGSMSNAMGSTVDPLVMLIEGDAEGAAVQFDELPLGSKHLMLRSEYFDVSKAAFQSYKFRGMKNTRKDDYNLFELSPAFYQDLELSANFFDRRIEIGAMYARSAMNIEAILDPKGNVLAQLDKALKARDEFSALILSLDLTDDYQDPRKGMRLNMQYRDRPATTRYGPDTTVTDFNGLFYVPMFALDTLVINYFQSSANVTRRGNTNQDDIRRELGANCAADDQTCLAAEQAYVDNTVHERRNGTATTLGGLNRLRSYADSRFQGAHTAFAGLEYRWNIVQEAAPFDYFIWKDVRTGIQLALFGELGTVSEKYQQLWDDARSSVGAGIRMLTGSGSVYRADMAYGSEGMELAVFFYYPWE